jgi:PTS system mannose-specific IID component
MRNAPHAAFLLVFMRTYLVGAAFNMRGLQNVGFLYAMEPGLAAIHRDSAALRKALNRYARHYNCHPYWTPLVAGMLLHTESEIAKGRMSPDAFGAIKDTAVNALSALGDSFFGGTLLVTWAVATAALLVSGHEWLALTGGGALFLSLQLFKLGTFVAGVRYGLSTLFWLRRWDLINWGDRLKIGNVLLLLLFLALCLPGKSRPALWGLAIPCIILAAWLTARLHVPRSLLALAATAAVLLLA